MRMTASWSGSRDPTEYKHVARCAPLQAGSPQIVIPTTTSVPPCSELSRYGLASAERGGKVGATANLDSSCARRLSNTAGRDEETGFQVEQRNRSRKQEARKIALKPLDNKSPIQGLPRAETGSRFLARTADFTRQRLGCPTSPSPKLREDKDISGGGRKPSLRGTAWWGW